MTGKSTAIKVLCLAALALSGCSSQVAVRSPSLPKPLLVQLPLKVAVRYGPEMEDYRYEEEVLGRQTWTIHLGSANKILFDHLFASMFSEVLEIGPEQDVAGTGADALIEASIDAFEFALPAQSRSDAYTVWIRYRLRIFDAEGKEISNWPISAYGKSGDGGMFGADEALARAAVLAMRDAAAMVGLRFAKETGLGDPGAIPTLPAPDDSSVAGETGPAVVESLPEDDLPGTDETAGSDEVPADPEIADEQAEAADVAANTGDMAPGNFTDDRG